MASEFKLRRESLRNRIAMDPVLKEFDLAPLARPSIRLAAQRVPYARIEIGDSRIGGIPDVPPGFEWPRWVPAEERNNKFAEPWRPDAPAPLGFIAQIDLSALPSIDGTFPNAGWLYFFYDRFCEPWGYDPADRGCCRVVYANCERSILLRTKVPPDADPQHTAEPCLVESWPELTLPEDFPDAEYGTPAYDAYHTLCEELTKGGGHTHHRLLGHPQIIQNPMELECQLASNGVYCGDPSGYQHAKAEVLTAGAENWRLLLQIDTDEEGPGWMWGDVGRIYFWIKKQDLATLRFDDVWLIFQCC
jgi:uncharacterized protein YwqG